MRVGTMALLWLLLGAGVAHAQAPAIAQDGVRNAASLLPPSLPQGSLAPGARIVIRGVRFGNQPQQSKVLLDSGSRRLTVSPLAAAPDRIEAQLPRDLAPGEYRLSVQNGLGTSQPMAVRVVESAPGLYDTNGQGWGRGRIDNLDASGRRVRNSDEHPASPGQRVAVRATGAGRRPQLMISGRRVQLLETRPVTDGEELIFKLPPDTPEGCFVPITGANTVTVAIRKGGGPCRRFEFFPLWRPGRVGLALLVRMIYKDLDSPREAIRDYAGAQFVRGQNGGPLLHIPPEGVCRTYVGDAQPEMGKELLPLLLAGASAGIGLDAGAYLSIYDGHTQKRIPPRFGVDGMYEVFLSGDEAPQRRGLPLFLSSGSFVMAGYGGKDLGSWNVSLPAPAAFRWTNRDAAAGLRRDQPLEVRWDGMAPSQRLLILVGSYSSDLRTSGYCQCLPAGGSTMTIAGAELARLPDGPGYIWLIAMQDHAPPGIPASGLDQSAAISVFCERQEFHWTSKVP